ncbi:hypothetical protein R1flu_020238 [Riccia fluitans]|uniref:Uncharacterized protein n=1 Tax=Riccia fluitans TaxID=41844 RepID=A0ABD1ZKY1_9MARC
MVSAPIIVIEDTTRATMREPVHGSHDNLEEDSASVPAYGRIVEVSLGDDNEEESSADVMFQDDDRMEPTDTSDVLAVDFSSVPSPAFIALSPFEGAIGVGVGLTSSTGASGSGSSVGIGGLKHESVSKSEVEISTAVDNCFGLSTALSLLPKKEEDNKQGNGPLVHVQQHLQNVMFLLGEVPVTNLKEDGQQAASKEEDSHRPLKDLQQHFLNMCLLMRLERNLECQTNLFGQGRQAVDPLQRKGSGPWMADIHSVKEKYQYKLDMGYLKREPTGSQLDTGYSKRQLTQPKLDVGYLKPEPTGSRLDMGYSKRQPTGSKLGISYLKRQLAGSKLDTGYLKRQPIGSKGLDRGKHGDEFSHVWLLPRDGNGHWKWLWPAPGSLRNGFIPDTVKIFFWSIGAGRQLQCPWDQ